MATIEPPVIGVLKQFYGTVTSLECYLYTALGYESAEALYRGTSVCSRLKSRRADIANIYVGLDRSLAELAKEHPGPKEVHVQSIADIIKSVQLLMFRKRQSGNILVQGYRTVWIAHFIQLAKIPLRSISSHHTEQPLYDGIVNVFPNSHVTTLKSKLWHDVWIA